MDNRKAGDKRKLGDDTGTLNELHLLQLPDAILSRTATFLDFKGRVMLVKSLPYWKEGETHDVIRAIVGAERIKDLILVISEIKLLPSSLTRTYIAS
ncbi:hypothetical protein ACHAXN_010952 [Cyclotella atomus]|jgi:hypothetical protein